MRIKWTPQIRGKGPRGTKILIWKTEIGTWKWELVDTECNILAEGERDEVLFAKEDVKEALHSFIKEEMRANGYPSL